MPIEYAAEDKGQESAGRTAFRVVSVVSYRVALRRGQSPGTSSLGERRGRQERTAVFAQTRNVV